MTKPTGKPLSGVSVHLRSWGAMALAAGEIKPGADYGTKMNRVLANAHIYLLCRRPRFAFDPDTFSYDGNTVSGDLRCVANGNPLSIHFGFPLALAENEANVTLSPSPHHEIRTLDAEGNCLRRISAGGLSQHPAIIAERQALNDLEVLYVGNVYEEGDTPVFDRIFRDAPLQHLLAELQDALPDDEVIIYAFEYLPYELVTLPGRLQHEGAPSGEGIPAGERSFLSLRDHPLTKRQKIYLAQAGLIHYFRPAWQETGDRMMPHPQHAAFTACESLDISGLILELSTIRSHFRLHTPHSALLPHHMTIIGLSDPAERAAFFAMPL